MQCTHIAQYYLQRALKERDPYVCATLFNIYFTYARDA